jgi:small GTP-binding protein
MSDAIQDKIRELESEYARTQKNKATATHLGLIKAKIAKLKKELLENATSSSGGGGGGRGFDVSKSGDARVGLVGFPSVGKSTLLTRLTGTYSEAASYEFTTLTAIPGTLNYNGAKIQILDLPGIIEGANDGKGRGRQVISAAYTCDVLMIVLDAMKPMRHKRLIEYELHGFGIRLNQQPPNIIFRKNKTGGINYQEMVSQSILNAEIVSNVLREFRVTSADVILWCDATVDQLIDVVEGNRRYVPCLYVCNKIDQLSIEELDIIDQLPHYVPISAAHGWGMDDLMENMWEYLNMIRVYTKPKGEIPDYNEPVVLRYQRRSIENLCNKLHRGIMDQFRYAWVWGRSVKHQPQKVGRDHVLEDEDVVQIVKNG